MRSEEQMIATILSTAEEDDRIRAVILNARITNVWNSLMEMMAIFHEIGLEIANKMDLNYNSVEANNVLEYMMKIKNRIVK